MKHSCMTGDALTDLVNFYKGDEVFEREEQLATCVDCDSDLFEEGDIFHDKYGQSVCFDCYNKLDDSERGLSVFDTLAAAFCPA